MIRVLTIATACLLLPGCAAFYEARDDIVEKCRETDLFAIQAAGVALRIWDCEGQDIGGRTVDPN